MKGENIILNIETSTVLAWPTSNEIMSIRRFIRNSSLAKFSCFNSLTLFQL